MVKVARSLYLVLNVALFVCGLFGAFAAVEVLANAPKEVAAAAGTAMILMSIICFVLAAFGCLSIACNSKFMLVVYMFMALGSMCLSSHFPSLIVLNTNVVVENKHRHAKNMDVYVANDDYLFPKFEAVLDMCDFEYVNDELRCNDGDMADFLIKWNHHCHLNKWSRKMIQVANKQEQKQILYDQCVQPRLSELPPIWNSLVNFHSVQPRLSELSPIWNPLVNFQYVLQSILLMLTLYLLCQQRKKEIRYVPIYEVSNQDYGTAQTPNQNYSTAPTLPIVSIEQHTLYSDAPLAKGIEHLNDGK